MIVDESYYPKRRVTVRAIVLHQGKLLCVRQKHYDGNIITEADVWCLPGGGLELDETITDGVRREMVEETGVEPVLGNLLYVQQFKYDGIESLEFFFEAINAKDYLEVDLSKTTHGEIEIAEVAFVDPKTTKILPEFLMTEDLPAAAASGQTKFFSFL